MSSSKPHTVSMEAAPRVAEWLRTRGGIALWNSADLSDPSASWITPIKDAQGNPATKPTWKAQDSPSRVITDPAEVQVAEDKEVRRFHVAIRMGANSFRVKLTDGSTRRVRAAVAKAGEGAYYTFDYDRQEAVIMAPSRVIPFPDWVASQTS